MRPRMPNQNEIQAFSKLLRDARGTRKQEEVAEEARVSQSLISLLERGANITGMRAVDLFRVLAVYNIEPVNVTRVLSSKPLLDSRIPKIRDYLDAHRDRIPDIERLLFGHDDNKKTE